MAREYAENMGSFDSNPQLRVNPRTRHVTIVNGSDLLDEIEVSDEVVESAAGVDGDASEAATDMQAARVPDFYPARKLLRLGPDGLLVPDPEAVSEIADNYWK